MSPTTKPSSPDNPWCPSLPPPASFFTNLQAATLLLTHSKPPSTTAAAAEKKSFSIRDLSRGHHYHRFHPNPCPDGGTHEPTLLSLTNTPTRRCCFCTSVVGTQSRTGIGVATTTTPLPSSADWPPSRCSSGKKKRGIRKQSRTDFRKACGGIFLQKSAPLPSREELGTRNWPPENFTALVHTRTALS